MHQHGRTLVLAFDGTANEFNHANTNVTKLCSVLQNNHDRQMVYYQAGIGTYTDPGIRGTIQQWFAKTADLAVAWYLDAHIRAGYEFLMENHLPGDTIVMFGFSRGSYTARALAGMLHSVGLLPKGNHEQVPFAYRIYKEQADLAHNFKATFCKTVDIKMLGVWDTVASVGYIIPRTLPFVSNGTIKAFRHAVSLDEHRTKWNVTLWKPEYEVAGRETRKPSSGKSPCVTEMWFAGCHSDVGGGNEVDGAPMSLSNIPLRWMLHEIQELDCGVLFDNDGLDRLKIPIDCVRRIPNPELDVNQRKLAGDRHLAQPSDVPHNIPTWDEADERDIKAPLHDRLKMKPLYWLLQIPSWTGKRWDITGTRIFPTEEEREGCDLIHPTVLMRMQQGYTPNAKLPQNWKALVVDGNASYSP